MAISIINFVTKSIGCTSGSIPIPTGVTAGDLLLMCYGVEDRNWPNESGSVTGFTELLTLGDVFGGTGRVLYKVVNQLETTGDTTYTINNLNKNCCVMLMALRGVDTTNPIDKSILVGRGNLDTTTGITTTINNSLIFQMSVSIRSTPTFSNWANSTNPLTWTEQCDFLGNRDISWCSSADGVGMGIATAIQTTAGDIGNTTFTSTPSNQANDIILVFNIKPALGISKISLFRKKIGGGIQFFKTGEYLQPIINKKIAINIGARGEDGIGIVGYYTGITWTPSSTGVQKSWIWNFLPSDVLGSTPTTNCSMSLKYTDGTSPTSSYWVQIMSVFSGLYNNGKITGNNTGVYPDSVLQYNLINATFSPMTSCNIRLSGLTTSMSYKVTIIGSRAAWDATSRYTITGGTTKDGTFVTLDTNDNTLNTVSITNIYPSYLGIIDISTDYTYRQGIIGAIEIDENG